MASKKKPPAPCAASSDRNRPRDARAAVKGKQRRDGGPSSHPLPDITAARQSAFLEVFAVNGNIRRSCEIAQVNRAQVYVWRRDDAAFEERFNHAAEEAADRLEEEARRRAVEGWDEPVFGRVTKTRDGQIGLVRKYSDKLLSQLLTGWRPERYNRTRVEHSGPDGTPIRLDTTKLSTEELLTLRSLLAKAGQGAGQEA